MAYSPLSRPLPRAGERARPRRNASQDAADQSAVLDEFDREISPVDGAAGGLRPLPGPDEPMSYMTGGARSDSDALRRAGVPAGRRATVTRPGQTAQEDETGVRDYDDDEDRYRPGDERPPATPPVIPHPRAPGDVNRGPLPPNYSGGYGEIDPETGEVIPGSERTIPGGGGEDTGVIGGGSASARYGTGNIPGAEDIEWGDTSTLRGFNTNEWGAGGSEGYEEASIKNTFGKIASRYPPKPSSLPLILNDPDFKKFFPEATADDKDRIDFGDGRPVDVLIAADEGADTAEGWAWQTMDDGGGGGGGGEGGGAGTMGGIFPGGFPTSADQLSEGDTLEQIMRALQELEQGRDPYLQIAMQNEMNNQGG